MFKWWNVVFQFSIFNGKKINYIHIRLDIVLGKLILYRILGRFFSSEINLYADLMNNANNEKILWTEGKINLHFLKSHSTKKLFRFFGIDWSKKWNSPSFLIIVRFAAFFSAYVRFPQYEFLTCHTFTFHRHDITNGEISIFEIVKISHVAT